MPFRVVVDKVGKDYVEHWSNRVNINTETIKKAERNRGTKYLSSNIKAITAYGLEEKK